MFWWLKPAFERLPLYILSKALFGETPTLKEALQGSGPGTLKSATAGESDVAPASASVAAFNVTGSAAGGPRAALPARNAVLQVLLQRNAGVRNG
jgi:hypothetical protein